MLLLGLALPLRLRPLLLRASAFVVSLREGLALVYLVLRTALGDVRASIRGHLASCSLCPAVRVRRSRRCGSPAARSSGSAIKHPDHDYRGCRVRNQRISSRLSSSLSHDCRAACARRRGLSHLLLGGRCHLRALWIDADQSPGLPPASQGSPWHYAGREERVAEGSLCHHEIRPAGGGEAPGRAVQRPRLYRPWHEIAAGGEVGGQ